MQDNGVDGLPVTRHPRRENFLFDVCPPQTPDDVYRDSAAGCLPDEVGGHAEPASMNGTGSRKSSGGSFHGPRPLFCSPVKPAFFSIRF